MDVIKIKRALFALSATLFLTLPAMATEAEERALEAKLEKQLEALLGPGKADVTVSGSDRPASQTRSVERSQAGTGHESRVTETTVETKRGAAGTEEKRSTRSSGSSSGIYNQSETIVSDPGGMSQKSVSVIYEAPKRGEDAEEDSSAPEVDQKMIEQLLRTGGGIDESSGDVLSVREVQMDTSAADKLREEMENQRQGTPWWIFALIAVGGAGLGTGTGLLIARRRRRSEPAPEWQNPAVQPMQQMPVQPAADPLAAGPQGPVVQIQPRQ